MTVVDSTSMFGLTFRTARGGRLHISNEVAGYRVLGRNWVLLLLAALYISKNALQTFSNPLAMLMENVIQVA